RTRAALESELLQNGTRGKRGRLTERHRALFYKLGERHSTPTPTPQRSSARSAFPPTQSEGAHENHAVPSPQQAGIARGQSAGGRSARFPHAATPTGTASRDGKRLCHVAGGARARLPASPARSPPCGGAMAVFHDEVEIEDFEYDEETETYSYPCPCGDRFLITRVTVGGDEGEAALGLGCAGRCVTVSRGLLQEDLENGEDVATCPSCSLILRVIYDQEQFMRDEVIAEPLTNKELVKC
uniref:Diphthamide biosynthesis protein 3 n=3 Tax=Neognathae TaxID=8825 RepID=A0A803Y8V4_MELGA